MIREHLHECCSPLPPLVFLFETNMSPPWAGPWLSPPPRDCWAQNTMVGCQPNFSTRKSQLKAKRVPRKTPFHHSYFACARCDTSGGWHMRLASTHAHACRIFPKFCKDVACALSNLPRARVHHACTLPPRARVTHHYTQRARTCHPIGICGKLPTRKFY